jgi:hypothetical protein
MYSGKEWDVMQDISALNSFEVTEKCVRAN